MQVSETKNEFNLALAGFKMPVTHLRNLSNNCLRIGLRHRVCAGSLSLGNFAQLVTVAVPVKERGCRLEAGVRTTSRSVFKKQEEGDGHDGEGGACVKTLPPPGCHIT